MGLRKSVDAVTITNDADLPSGTRESYRTPEYGVCRTERQSVTQSTAYFRKWSSKMLRAESRRGGQFGTFEFARPRD